MIVTRRERLHIYAFRRGTQRRNRTPHQHTGVSVRVRVSPYWHDVTFIHRPAFDSVGRGKWWVELSHRTYDLDHKTRAGGLKKFIRLTVGRGSSKPARPNLKRRRRPSEA